MAGVTRFQKEAYHTPHHFICTHHSGVSSSQKEAYHTPMAKFKRVRTGVYSFP